MVTYDSLLIEAQEKGIIVFEEALPPKLHGIYKDRVICINSTLPMAYKVCAMIEELGHDEKTVGNILDQSKLENRKQEKHARSWGYPRLMPLSIFISANAAGVRNRYEFAQFVGVTEEYVIQVISRYQEIYGIHAFHEGHIIMFDPLMVLDPISL